MLKKNQESKIKNLKNVIAGVDFGYVNPSAIVVINIDNDDRYYVIDELYRSGLTISELIYKCIKLRDTHGIDIFFADPSQPAYIREMNNNGLYTLPAKNALIPGIDAVSEMMRVREDGQPSLIIDKKCKNLIYELENYRYVGDEGEGVAFKEIPIKEDDHACDALRYAIFSMKTKFSPKSFKPRWL